ncbi:MAG TPA: TOBE domain-containing protein [Planctomycetota bacterium]|nr:TOBE domain-containing protein [Planctomycetota bacterium]
MKYGARNQIVGKVTAVKKGTLMCQVTLDVKGPVEVSSVMTLDSLKELGLKKGDKVRAVVKAIHVLLVKE